MFLRPQVDDFKVIGFYIGKIIMGIGLAMSVPLIVALLFREWNPAFDFCIGLSICIILGKLLVFFSPAKKDLNWMQGMLVVSLSWLVAMFLAAIPLFLSGHWLSYLDACFDAMSGLATTGLVLVQDLDHLSYAHNMWRHLLMYMGGQGIVVIALTFLVGGASSAFRIYVGEAREERILPNVIQTARFIWMVSLIYLFLGAGTLCLLAYLEGIPAKRAILHGLWVFMAAFDTGGFAPQSQNILYYHSLPFELATVAIMVLGAINFKLHYALWTGNRKEIWRNIEIVTLFISVVAGSILVSLGLKASGTYLEGLAMFRKGFYQFISGHLGCGYTTVYAKQFIQQWSPLALGAIIIAMSLGGGICSTTGGIKALRIGLVFKALLQDIKRLMASESTIVSQKFHHIKDMVLEERQVRAAALITLSYIFLYCLGAIAGMLFGYPLLESLFESTSAAANVGLSCGITQASMPEGLKVIYILQMWTGRLEFMCVFTLLGFIIAYIKGR